MVTYYVFNPFPESELETLAAGGGKYHGQNTDESRGPAPEDRETNLLFWSLMALLGPLLALLFNTGHLLDTFYLASLMLVDSRGQDWS